MMNFIECIDKNIRPLTKIENWSVFGNIKVPYFTYVKIDGDYCLLENPNTKKIISIPESSFQFLHRNWKSYINKAIKRVHLMHAYFYTTYTICIYNYLYKRGLVKG